MNCQSIVRKRAFLDNLIDCHNPKIIIGTESWLNSNITSSEIFPTEFQVIRRDRPAGHGGGIFIAWNKLFSWQEIHLQTDCEIVASKLILSNYQSLIVIALYRPPNSDYI